MKRVLLMGLMLCFGIAQSQSLKGKVVGPNNNPLENVAIFDRNSGNHTHTDASEKFSLENVKENDTISFSILGFATLEYSVYSCKFFGSNKYHFR